MSQRIRSSLRARIVVAFTLFGVMLGAGVTAVSWLAPGVAHALAENALLSAATGGCIVIIGVFLGRYVARCVLGPLESLAEAVESSPPERLADALSECTYDREVGVLALCLEEAMRRQTQFVDRERRFTGYVSHELRSPVAVIRGAAELLAASPHAGDSSVHRPLARIERSVADMQEIIEAFLWLGRERKQNETQERADVVATVQAIITRNRHLIEHKAVEVQLQASGRPTVAAPAAVLGVVVGNLVANSFRYTDTGQVVITVEPHVIVVTDSGVGMAPETLESCTQSYWRGANSPGHGVGLSIVRSLCDRFAWRMCMESHPGHGTTVKLYF